MDHTPPSKREIIEWSVMAIAFLICFAISLKVIL